MFVRRLHASVACTDFHLSLYHRKFSKPLTCLNSKNYLNSRNSVKLGFQRTSSTCYQFIQSNLIWSNVHRLHTVRIPPVETAGRAELFRALEASLGHSFSSNPLTPSSKPLIIVISGPSGVGKDAVIKRLTEVRREIHCVVTATSRAKRPGEEDGKDYYFITKDEFLSMVSRNEFLEYALVYGEYKGVPKQQIREFMAKGHDIILRVDIQGAAKLKHIFGDSAVFVFVAVESETELVERLIDRRTETAESLIVRVNTAREEIKHVKSFDYVVVNAKGKLESAVMLLESIIDAEKAKVRQRGCEDG